MINAVTGNGFKALFKAQGNEEELPQWVTAGERADDEQPSSLRPCSRDGILVCNYRVYKSFPGNSTGTAAIATPVPHFNLTSGAGVAQGAADFILVQMRPWDHQDVGNLAQGAVIRSLAPHFFWGQGAALQGRAGRDIKGAGAFPGTALSLSYRSVGGPTNRGLLSGLVPRVQLQKETEMAAFHCPAATDEGAPLTSIILRAM